MKNINNLIEEVKTNAEFRARLFANDEAGLQQMLRDEGYEVSLEEVIKAVQAANFELSPEELEKVSGGGGGNTIWIQSIVKTAEVIAEIKI